MGWLWEREAQLTRLAALARDAQVGAGGGLLLEGDGGVGKTSLVERFSQEAAQTGLRLLRARGIESERGYSFGVVHQLLRTLVPKLAHGDPSLTQGPARRAAALALGEPVGNAEPFEIDHALYWLLVNLADHGPIAVIVDDAHHADDASLGFLEFLAERCRGHTIALVVARRPEARVRARFTALGPLPVAPLSPAGSVALIEQVMGDSDAAFDAACHNVTAGNPFLLRELLGELTREGVSPTADNAVRVRGIVPDAVRRSALVRLAGLAPGDVEVVQAGAVLGDDAPIRGVTGLVGRPAADIAGALDRLHRARILLANHEWVRFVHPLVQAAVYEEIAPAARGRLHARAAAVLEADGAPVEAVAAHVLRAPSSADPETVALLRRAAAAARVGHADEAAAEFLERALAEGVVEGRADLELELGTTIAATDPVRAEIVLRSAREAGLEPHQDVEAALQLGRALQTQGRMSDAAEVLGAALSRTDEVDDEALTLPIFAEYVSTAVLAGHDMGEALSRTLALIEEFDPATAHVSQLEATAALALQMAMVGEDERALALADRALAGGRLIDLAGGGSPALSMCTGVLHARGDYDRDLEVIAAAHEDTQRRGSPVGFAMTSYLRASALYPLGRVVEAIADAEAAIAGAAAGWQQYLPAAYAFLALGMAERGHAPEALGRLEEMGVEQWAGSPMFGILIGMRGRVRAHVGELEEALADMQTWRELFPVPNPEFWGEWRSASAEVLIRLGRADEALELAEEELEIVTGRAAYAVGRAQRVRALCLPAAEQVTALREAVATLAPTSAHLERIRATVDLGAALRRAGDNVEARELLRAVVTETDGLGLTLLGDRASAELVAAGARPRRRAAVGPDSLTPSESRVATMAASGLTNREIAIDLFVTPKAVEFHLAHAYRKLGIKGRGELAAALLSR